MHSADRDPGGGVDRRAPGDALGDLLECMVVLRGQCPWDRAQTHASLRRHLLEETHETLEVLDRIAATEQAREDRDGDTGDNRSGDVLFDDVLFDDLCEELGDVLFQVVFHAHLAAEERRFDLTDVIDGVHDKLVARHPRIFEDRPDGASTETGPADGAAWEQAKVAEKGRDSVMDGIPGTLPALAYATKVVGKARAVAPSLVEGLGVDETPEDDRILGRQLLELVAAARRAGLDAEAALRTTTRDLERRIRDLERDH